MRPPAPRCLPIQRSLTLKCKEVSQPQVRDARAHDARHTAATLLIEQGVHIRVVQEVLGHIRVTTTERYTHVATLQMKDASERMDQALWGQG